jgi:DNA polymerase III gamma/tau subunit
MTTTVRPDILRWAPPRWELFLGNHRIIKHFKGLVKKLRRLGAEGPVRDLNKLCFLLYGPSRSGKTALVKFLVRCITCQRLNPETLNPCEGDCPACRQKPELCGLEGLFTDLLLGAGSGERMPLHFAVVDCTLIHTPEQLREKLITLTSYSGIRLYYLDEVHRLVHRGMDEMLLKAVEEKDFLWFFSTAKPGGLEDMLQNRLLKFTTEAPTAEKMEAWLADRCNEWGINWEPEAVMRVVEKSNCIVGTALHALALASIDPEEGLTLDLVENDWVVKLDE